MHSSHKPRTLTIAVEDANHTHQLLGECQEFVLAVPGENLIEEAIYFGTASMREHNDKIAETGLKLVDSSVVDVPSISAALGHIELSTAQLTQVHDHTLITGRVRAYTRTAIDSAPLLSIGPDTEGFRLLKKVGVHRIAVAR